MDRLTTVCLFPSSLRLFTETNPTTKLPELYTKGQYPIYNKGARGVDPNPYSISKVLGDGQYHLERGGKCDGKVYRQENLQTEP